MDEVAGRTRAAAARFAALLHGADGGRAIPGMDWTVAEAAAHVVNGLDRYVDLLRGKQSPLTDVSQVPADNAAHLAEYTERDTAALAKAMPEAADRLVAAYDEVGADSVVEWHEGLPVSARETLGTMLGELVVHGWDVAQGLGRPFKIDPADAIVILESALPLIPLYVKPEKAKGLDGTVVMKLRGGPAVPLFWKDGSLSMGQLDQPVEKADVTISAEPVSFLLSSYGRGSRWRPILTGKVLAYGRKPMLALKMQAAIGTP